MNDEQDLRLKCLDLAARLSEEGVIGLAGAMEKFVRGEAKPDLRVLPPVTEAMVQAGVAVVFARPLNCHDPAGAFAERIYRAMDAAKPKG